MASSNSALSVIGTDFDSIKGNLKTYLQGQTQFNDYDFNGSNINALLDVLSYNTYMNLFYVNQALNETFLDSAVLHDSIVSRAKELNYVPSSAVSANATINISMTTSDTPAYIVMPIGTQFTSKIDNSVYKFNTTENIVLNYSGNHTYTANSVVISEGTPVTEVFSANTFDIGQKFVLSNPSIDISTLKVIVQNSSSDTVTNEFIFAPTLLDLTGTSNVYFLQGAANGNYEVVFGDGVSGTSIKNGNYIGCSYLASSGTLPNGCSNFNILSNVWANTVATSISTTIAADGGADAETAASIQFNAPRHYQTQERAIVPDDYKSLIARQFPQIRAINVYGGETVSPPQYGTVVISVDLKGDAGVSVAWAEKIESFIKTRMPVTIRPKVVAPNFLYVKVGINVNYNVNASTSSPSTVQALIGAVVNTFNATYMDDFDCSLYYSRLAAAIDNSDVNIISNDLSLQVAQKFIPVLTDKNSWVFTYGQPINTGSVQSTLFVHGNSVAFFGDDGAGIINVYTADASGTKTIVAPSVGTINYETGDGKISDVLIDSFLGNTLDLVATTSSLDIKAYQNAILTIFSGDIVINVTPVRA